MVIQAAAVRDLPEVRGVLQPVRKCYLCLPNKMSPMSGMNGLGLEAPPGFEPGIEVLQTSALPLGDGAD